MFAANKSQFGAKKMAWEVRTLHRPFLLICLFWKSISGPLSLLVNGVQISIYDFAVPSSLQSKPVIFLFLSNVFQAKQEKRNHRLHRLSQIRLQKQRSNVGRIEFIKKNLWKSVKSVVHFFVAALQGSGTHLSSCQSENSECGKYFTNSPHKLRWAERFL
jgi:hypothetical protein